MYHFWKLVYVCCIFNLEITKYTRFFFSTEPLHNFSSVTKSYDKQPCFSFLQNQDLGFLDFFLIYFSRKTSLVPGLQRRPLFINKKWSFSKRVAKLKEIRTWGRLVWQSCQLVSNSRANGPHSLPPSFIQRKRIIQSQRHGKTQNILYRKDFFWCPGIMF